MNGRVFAVNRSPVLAWNVEPQQLQVPFPDMPAAAAAAISPVVPAASDPYGRCWQNQVDAGTGYPYFGTLYSNSLPPPAYRLQPGCMANLGQFWPPTPPPDGCGRFDGSNLYFAPPVTPVLRHGENVPQNLRNSFQGLGHYSHLVETPKESSSNQRTFKQETSNSPSVSVPSISMCSSVTKSDNLSTYCVVDSKLKPLDSIISGSSKQEAHHSVSTSGHESYSCVPDNRSSNSHPSTEKACFSPPYPLKSTLFHNSPSQDVTAHKPKSQSLGLENNCNASPLKNVYFSHFESENVNPVPSKNFSNKHYDGQFGYEHKNNVVDVDNKHLKQPHQSMSNNAYLTHNVYTAAKKYDFHANQEHCTVSPSYSTTRSERTADRLALMSDHCRQSNFYKVKPEKSSHPDCKFQKLSSKRNSSVIHVPDYRSLKEVFNIPTSLVHPKIEPNDKYFLSTCPSTAQSCMAANSYVNSAPLLVSKDFTSDPRTSSSYHNMLYPNSCALGKPWQLNGMPLMNHPDNYFKAPEAAKPPIRGTAPTSSALHEGLISVAQTAPQDMDILKSSGKYNNHTSSTELIKRICHEDTDDEVQVIAVQTKNNSSSSKHNSRKSAEARSSMTQSVAQSQLCFKSEKDQEPKFDSSKFSPSLSDQHRKSVLHMGSHASPSPSLLEQPGTASVNDAAVLSVQSKPCDLTTNIKQNFSPMHDENFRFDGTQPLPTAELLDKCCSKLEALNQNNNSTYIDNNSKSLPDVMFDSPEINNATVKPDPDQEELSSKINQNDSSNLANSIKLEERSLEDDHSSMVSDSMPSLVDSVQTKDEFNNGISPNCIFNENHGLNLLLDTIEKVTSFESLEKPDIKPIIADITDIAPATEISNSDVKECANKTIKNYPSEISFCTLGSSNARGLDLLSAIAGQRFLTEFDSVKCESEDSSHIKSNYPEVKEEIEVSQCNDMPVKSFDEANMKDCPTSVFEMRDRLVELQKKYKQKQKELSRLKPKKMLTHSYLRERQRKLSTSELLNSSETLSNISTCSNPEMSTFTLSSSEDAAISTEELPLLESLSNPEDVSSKSSKNECEESVKEHVSLKRKLRDFSLKPTVKNSQTEETVVACRPRTRRSLKAISKTPIKDNKSKSSDECGDILETPKKITRNHTLNIKEQVDQNCDNSPPTNNDEIACTKKDSSKAEAVIENAQHTEKSKNYTLRKTQSTKRLKVQHPSDVALNSVATHSKTMPSKRKSDNPKKYMPSKQSKLSETIVAKHLRNRILFDTSGSVSDDDNQKDGGVPEELYDALMKCHLGEENKASLEELNTQSNSGKESSDVQLGFPEPSKLKPEHLVEKHRLLALEDGLMYAGCIKEVQGSDRYGIALDGQRGNRLHIFTREELLTQTITESKPTSSELPEGTRVCAYWSQQYRCLYPGIVGKAPCPSADWSEPRVFVQFDDGDSGQIPIKNIRLIPSDIFPSEEEHNQQSETSSIESTDGSKSKCSNRGNKSRRLRNSRKHSRPKRREETQRNECKESSCTSINDSSCDDSCFNDSSVSPSQTSENPNCIENNSQCSLQTLANNPDAKSEKRLRKHSKRKASSKIKLKEMDVEKSKRHKRYKDKHRHHHHHHHHHHRHHHHHHHSKKRKHRRRNGSNSKNLTFSQDVDVQEAIPPGGTSVSKRRKNTAENGCLDHVGHSTVDLPQNK